MRHERTLHGHQFGELLEALPAAVYTTDVDGHITFCNEAAIDLWGVRPRIGTDRWCGSWRLYWPDGTPMPHDQCPMAVALKEGRPIRDAEAILERPDGTRVPFIPYPTPLRDESGAVVGAVNMLVDITSRKQAEDTQKLLVGELNHRVKNTLATVQALARQTLSRASEPASFVASFNGRVDAMARAHAVLTRSSWRGADLAALVREQLLIEGQDERVTCAGPEVMLPPQQALHLAMVLHELGTNARKHGALAAPAGRVTVVWTVETADSRVLHLRWAESGGPRVSASSPAGFGSVLIRESLKPHGGEARMRSEAEGVTWEISLPLPEPRAQAREPGRSASDTDIGRVPGEREQDPAHADLAGRRILVVEDEPLLALDVASSLAAAGIVVVGPAATVEEALRQAESAALDGALLDANLDGHPVGEIAAALTRRNVPFAFVTGYGRESLPRAFAGALVVTKPFGSRELLEAVRRLAPGRDSDVVPMRAWSSAAP
jgi:PAS domain S-box-containing protein